MKLLPVLLAVAVSTTGCAAAKSAMGALGGSKPAEITVTNHIETAPVQVRIAEAPAHKAHPIAVIAGGAVAGAAVGALASMSTGKLRTNLAAGAGIGALLGGLVVVAR